MSYWPGRRPSTLLTCLVSYKRAMSVVSAKGPVGLLPVYKEANMWVLMFCVVLLCKLPLLSCC